jgi:hypothetical protein
MDYMNEHSVFQYWENDSNFECALLDIHGVAMRHQNILSTCTSRPEEDGNSTDDRPQPYWEFGELFNNPVLECFPGYDEAAIECKDDGNERCLPLNGRYIIHLFLADEPVDVTCVGPSLTRVLTTPFPEPDMNILTLAILSEVIKNQLVIEAQLIERLPWNKAGQAIMTFLYNECPTNIEVARCILSRVFHIMGNVSGFRSFFLRANGDSIVNHLKHLDLCDFSTESMDPLVNITMDSIKDQILTEDNRDSLVRVARENMCQNIKLLWSEGESIIKMPWCMRKMPDERTR